MKAIGAFIKRHPLLSYFALAFALSWGVVFIVIVVGHGSMLATKEQFETLFPIMGPAMLLGSSVAGILLTGLLYGKAGFRDFLDRIEMEGWSSLVRCGSPYSPARVHGDTPCALAKVPRVPPPHIHIRRERAALVLMGIVGGLRWASSRSWAGRGSPYPH